MFRLLVLVFLLHSKKKRNSSPNYYNVHTRVCIFIFQIATLTLLNISHVMLFCHPAILRQTLRPNSDHTVYIIYYNQSLLLQH